MVGSIAAACFAVSHSDVGDLEGLLRHEDIVDKLTLIPDFSLAPSQNPDMLSACSSSH